MLSHSSRESDIILKIKRCFVWSSVYQNILLLHPHQYVPMAVTKIIPLLMVLWALHYLRDIPCIAFLSFRGQSVLFCPHVVQHTMQDDYSQLQVYYRTPSQTTFQYAEEGLRTPVQYVQPFRAQSRKYKKKSLGNGQNRKEICEDVRQSNGNWDETRRVPGLSAQKCPIE